MNWPQNDYWLGPIDRRPASRPPTPSGTSRGPSSSACRSSTGSRPNARGPTAKPAGRGCGCGPTWSAPTTAWPRRPISANRGGSRPSSPCSSSTSAPRPGVEARRRQDAQAEPFPDSVGVGSYRIDLHPSTGGDNYIDISSLPFQVPLGALIPRRVENLLPACKNLGTTHITNGCYRLASGRVGHRRGRRCTGGLLPGAQGITPRGPEHATPTRRLPVASDRPGSRDRLAAGESEIVVTR